MKPEEGASQGTSLHDDSAAKVSSSEADPSSIPTLNKLSTDGARDAREDLQIPILGVTEDSIESKAEAIARSVQDALQAVDVPRDSLELMNYDQLLAYAHRLRDALILANAEAEFFRQQWQQQRLANEAMGIDILTGDAQALQQRLVQAVKELYNTEQERRQAIKALDELSKASLNLIRSGSGYNPMLRAQFEQTYRSAQRLIEGKGASPIPMAQSLADAQIVGVNLDLKTVIINVGSSHGVEVGMPFYVLRNDIVIGSIKVLQTRETISAAVIEEVRGNEIFKTKDRVILAVQKAEAKLPSDKLKIPKKKFSNTK
ncbi:MAG: rod shape-determining protein MreC [Methylacidiphilales bacterium]|nr:rod shape-determining protein MreC [Candidatus Methylacidiphilales bacterium]MDW8348984.1 hypothetical protein [Verrucomicrobiae bacterium]